MLLQSAQIPGLLEPELRDMIASNIETLSDQAVSGLLKMISASKQKLETIDKNFDLQELPLKEKCMEVMKNFQRTGITEAVKAVEAKSQKENPDQLNDILTSLDDA